MSKTEMILAPSSVPNADPIYYKDATELAFLIRTKQLSSREVVQAHLDRIEKINPKINAIVTRMVLAALRCGLQHVPVHLLPATFPLLRFPCVRSPSVAKSIRRDPDTR
jgi:hypothetical protein